MIKKTQTKKGMTLFIAIVVMSILLFVSFAVANIALKATIFATSGRDSQYAFYAADAGMECAMYWDSKPDTSKFDITTGGTSINCSGTNIIDNSSVVYGTTTSPLPKAKIGGSNYSVFGFYLYPTNPTAIPYCAIVTVQKYNEGARLWTYIKSKGYNTCDTSNKRRVERGIEVKY